MNILENLSGLFGHDKKGGEVTGVTGFKPEENTKGIEVTGATPEDLLAAQIELGKKLRQELVRKTDPEDVKWGVDEEQKAA